MSIVPSQKTPVSPSEAMGFLRAAVLAQGGDEALARLVIAQSHLETGGWHSTWNYNLGNLRGSWNGMTTSIPGAQEYDDSGALVTVSAGFRAYPGFQEGAGDKVSLLARSYPNAWAAREPTSYVDGLWKGKIGSYFGVPPKNPYGPEGRAARDRYEAGLRGRYKMLFGDSDFPKDPGADSPPPPVVSPPSPSSPLPEWLQGRFALDGSASVCVLRPGSLGPLVGMWQKALGVPVTGVFDSKTVGATMVLQRAAGLTPDGVVGSDTWRAYLLRSS